MIEGARGELPGQWIALGLRGDGELERSVPVGYGAYAEVVHDRQASETPDDLSQGTLQLLISVLAGHTSTPDECFFGQWTVWGYLTRPTRIWTFREGAAHAHDPEPRAEQAHLRVLAEPFELEPGFIYQLFSGPLAVAEMIGNWSDEHTFRAHAPDLIWPQDRAWCVRRDGDSDTVVAGSSTLIREIVANPGLNSRLI